MHLWVNIRHDLASVKNRLFAVLSNSARHAPKLVEPFADLYLRQSSRQRMSYLLLVVISVVSLCCTHRIREGLTSKVIPSRAYFTLVQQDFSIVLGDYLSK
jgi:hypothetical protein